MTKPFDYNKENFEKRIQNYNGKIKLTSNDKNSQIVFNKILSIFDKNKNNLLDADEIRTIFTNLYRTGVLDNKKTKDIDESRTDTNTDGVFTLKEIEAQIKRNPVLKKLNVKPENLIWFLKVISNTIGKDFAKQHNATKKRILDSYNKKYPADKYTIKTEKADYFTIITVTQKGSNSVLRQCTINEDGSYIIKTGNGADEKTNKYDKNGKLTSYTYIEKKKNCNITIYKDAISELLHKDITTKKGGIIPTTGKDIEKHIKRITSQNVIDVIDNYKRNYGQDLLDAINKEWGLDKNIKKRLIDHINNCIKKSSYWMYNEPDTKINMKLAQGKMGDCWLLGTIAAIASKPKGLKILNETIKKTTNGDYIVKFKGCDKSYKVTAFELYTRSPELSNGDIDIIILEIAADKHFNFLGINGGNPATAMDLILGTSDEWKNAARFYNPVSDSKEKLKKLIKNPNTIVMTSVNIFTKIGLSKDKEYFEEIATQHAYAVVDIDDTYVYLKNPWHVDDLTEIHEEKTFKMPIEDFQKYLTNIQYVTLE